MTSVRDEVQCGIPFISYLEAKRGIDDHSLNKRVLDTLKAFLPSRRLKVVEVGAGIGTMVSRLIDWGVIREADYVACDSDERCVESAGGHLGSWAFTSRHRLAGSGDRCWEITGNGVDVAVRFEEGDYRGTLARSKGADLVIANSFMDLVDMPGALRDVLSTLRPNGLFYLTLNFDGLTAFHPVSDPLLDSRIIARFHERMDARSADPAVHRRSRTGRDLIRWLGQMEVRVLDVGCSDWVVLPMEDGYKEGERTFLLSIIGIIETELRNDDAIGREELARWVMERRGQVERGELIYIAHQLDVVGAVNV